MHVYKLAVRILKNLFDIYRSIYSLKFVFKAVIYRMNIFSYILNVLEP